MMRRETGKLKEINAQKKAAEKENLNVTFS